MKSIKQFSNRNQANCILVDDNELNFRENEGSCIRISPFQAEIADEDDELIGLTKLLELILKMSDFHGFLRKVAQTVDL